MYPNLSDCFDTQMLSPSNSSSGDSDDSDYILTPPRGELRRPLLISVPHHCIFLDLKQIERFVDHLNDMKHLDVREGWYPLKWSPVVWEGPQQLHTSVTDVDAHSILKHPVITQPWQTTTSTWPLRWHSSRPDAHTQHIARPFSIKPVSSNYFMMTIETLHPIVEDLVNDVCERETTDERHESRKA